MRVRDKKEIGTLAVVTTCAILYAVVPFLPEALYCVYAKKKRNKENILSMFAAVIIM